MNQERKIETEEVTEVASPPRARISETLERKRDYLEGFLAQQPKEALDNAVKRGNDQLERFQKANKG